MLRRTAILLSALCLSTLLFIQELSSVDAQTEFKIPLDARTIGQRAWDNAGEIYKPQLPNAAFLDATQAQIAKTKHPKVDDLILFLDPRTGTGSNVVPSEYRLKPWSIDEQSDVERILARLLEIAPGVVINAASGEKLVLCRTSGNKNNIEVASGNRMFEPSGFACPGAVLISDSFFKSRQQFQALTHELVHEADTTGRVCYSKEFIRLVNPTISEARIRFANVPLWVVPRLGTELVSDGVVPSAYACENLTEALAEIISSYVAGTFRPQTQFMPLISKFLKVTSNDLIYDSEFKHARMLMGQKEYERAATILQERLKSNAASAEVHVALCTCYRYTKRTADAAIEAKDTTQLLRAAGTPYSDPGVLYALRSEVTAYKDEGKYYEALNVANELLLHVPFDPDSLYRASYIEWETHDISQSVADQYLAIHSDDYAAVLQNADSDPELLSKLLDKSVEECNSFPLTLLRRAHFNEWLGGRESNLEERMNDYKRALTDYERLKKLDTSDFPEVAFDRCNLLLHMGRQSDAENLLAEETRKQPDAIETDLMRVQILASKGQDAQAKDLCLKCIYPKLHRK